jgi:hypothetical protein
MKRLIIITTLALLSSVWVEAQTPSERPEFSKLKPEAQTMVLTWLNKNCGAAEQSEFEKKLIQIGVVLEPVLWETFRLGPTEQELKNISTAVAKRYEERQSWLRQFGDAQMGKEETKRQVAITKKQYVNREIMQYAERYKTAALAGLGLIGTQRSRAELKRIAGDAKNPSQTAAQEALKAILRKRVR